MEIHPKFAAKLLLSLCLLSAMDLRANVAGGGTGTGPNVTVTQAGGSVVLANGIVSMTINTANGNVTAFSYNGVNYLAGGHGGGGGYFYIDGSGGPTLANPTYTLTVNPATNGGNQAEVELQTLASPMDCTLYYDLLRGQQGIYDTLILTHETGYVAWGGAELRTNMYVGGQFNWICVDPYRFRQMASTSDTYTSPGGNGSPKEVFDFTSGIYSGTTGCKYSYSETEGNLNAWGWASTTSKNGVWQILPSHEFWDGGPMHRELTAHLGNTLLDMFGGGHYGFGNNGNVPAGVFASKTFGPAFIYANQYTGAATNVPVYAQALFQDAQAQAAAEQAAWPYAWFNPRPLATGSGTTASAYLPASGRGSVSGTFAINDPYNPGASPAGMWIGLAPVAGGLDFQEQYFTSQFWVTSTAGGAFTIPNVQPGTYNLWAFGPGAAGTFQRPNVTVAAGQALNLGTVTWTPLRLGPTVWQIGVPDRNSTEFNNGDHDVSPWSGVLPPYAGGAPYNSPAVWSAFMAYPTQYPNGVSYTVGVSNYANDWNYCQPTVNNGGAYVGTTSKIFFNMPRVPAAGNLARLYLAFSAADGAACILTINGKVQTASVTGSTDGVNAATIGNATTGFYPPNFPFDTTVRLGSNGTWGDAYLDFPVTDLNVGWNEIDIGLRPAGGAGIGNFLEYDFLRLECQGFNPSPTPTPQTAGSSTASPSRTRSPSASPSPSPTHTASATPSSSPTRTVSPTDSPSASASPTRSASASPSLSPTDSPSSTHTASPSGTASSSFTPSASPSASTTSTPTASPSAVPSFSSTPTLSPSAAASSSTVSPSRTSSPSASPSPTHTASATPSSSPTRTVSPTDSPSASASPTRSASASPSLSPTDSPSSTHTASPSGTASSSYTPSASPSASATSTPTASPSAMASFSSTPTLSPSAAATPSDTHTPSPTPTATASNTVTPSATATPTATATADAISHTPTPVMPVLISISPTALIDSGSGTGPFTLSLSGSNLLPGATLHVNNGPPIPLTLSTTASATASLPNLGAGVAGSTTYLITVTNPDGLSSAALPLTVTKVGVTATPAPSGALVIDQAQAVPDPNPRSLRVLLEGPADSVTLKIWSLSLHLLAVVRSGPSGPGWMSVNLPGDFTARAAAGLYYFSVSAKQGGRVSRSVVGKLVLLR